MTAAAEPTIAQGFAAPPSDARPLVRWWWFGPAVEQSELAREIATMRAGGFGGFEIQPVYPLALDDPTTGVRNLKFLSDEFLADVRFAADTARAQNMRLDITLGSGTLQFQTQRLCSVTRTQSVLFLHPLELYLVSMEVRIEA